MNTIPMKVTEGLTVSVIPDSNHEYLMPSKEVAKGYGVSVDALRLTRKRHAEELIEGKHFLRNVTISNASSVSGVSVTSAFTKYGIIRLGFFIKSDTAKQFRDWAEDLIINYIEKKATPFQETSKKLEERYVKRPEFDSIVELVDSTILACGSANQLAARIGVNAATISLIKSRPWLVSNEKLHGIELACKNLLSRDAEFDLEAFEQLLKIEDQDLRLFFFNKCKRGGLL